MNKFIKAIVIFFSGIVGFIFIPYGLARIFAKKLTSHMWSQISPDFADY